MKSSEFRNSIDQLHARLVELTATKGEEYKRREDNQFANFERGAKALGLTREQVLMVYLSKHLDSITTFVKDQANPDTPVREYAEPITGRIDDAILYLLLLRGMVTECDSPRAPEDSIMRKTHFRPGADAFAQMAPTDTVHVISRDMALAAAECHRRGLAGGSAALSTVDQLHGVKPGGLVVYVPKESETVMAADDIHYADAEENAFWSEVAARCERQGLQLMTMA